MRSRGARPWIDITMEFGHPAGTWPGDAPFSSEWTGRIGDGRWAVNLSRFCSSPHNGTHTDAPFHVDQRGAKSESLPLDAYLGPCAVVDATKTRGTVVGPEIVDSLGSSRPPRILIRTRTRPPRGFPKSFAGLSVDLARRLAAHRVRLVGTDAPSVDAPGSRGLAAHKILFGAGAVLLENLDLVDVRPGRYDLVALPLKVSGLCAAPVRAILRPRRF